MSNVFICLKRFFFYLDKWYNWNRDECCTRVQMCNRASLKWCRPAGFGPQCHDSGTQTSPFSLLALISEEKSNVTLQKWKDAFTLAFTYYIYILQTYCFGFTNRKKNSIHCRYTKFLKISILLHVTKVLKSLRVLPGQELKTHLRKGEPKMFMCVLGRC